MEIEGYHYIHLLGLIANGKHMTIKENIKLKSKKEDDIYWEQWKVRQSLVLNQKKKGIIQFLFIIFLYIIQKME